MKTKEDKKEFYNRCSVILNIEHDYKEPVPRRNRWNTRRLGNGRYPGFGLIHCYGSTVRVMSKHGTKMFSTYEEVYDYLVKLVDNSVESM
jgi:hypothetical protein